MTRAEAILALMRHYREVQCSGLRWHCTVRRMFGV